MGRRCRMRSCWLFRLLDNAAFCARRWIIALFLEPSVQYPHILAAGKSRAIIVEVEESPVIDAATRSRFRCMAPDQGSSNTRGSGDREWKREKRMKGCHLRGFFNSTQRETFRKRSSRLCATRWWLSDPNLWGTQEIASLAVRLTRGKSV